MPIYEYRCEDCQATFEALLYGDERARCPHCEGTRLARLLSSFAVGRGPTDAGACDTGGCACPYASDPGACPARG